MTVRGLLFRWQGKFAGGHEEAAGCSVPRDYAGDLIHLADAQNTISPTSALDNHLSAMPVGFNVDPEVALEPTSLNNLVVSLAAQQLSRHSLESPPRAALYISEIVYMVEKALSPTQSFSGQ
jgi:hypothetical protein